MTTDLKLLLLGKPELLINHTPVSDLPTNKTLALLCYLAVAGQAQERRSLARLLWSEEKPEDAQNSLRVALSHLNQRLPGCLESSRDVVGLHSEQAIWLDVAHFAEATRTLGTALPDLAALRTAAALYRGDFLEGLFVDGASAFEEWLLAEREHWRQTLLATLRQLAELLVAQRDYTEAAATLERLLLLEPWDEEAHRLLMTVYSRTGDFNRALLQYEVCRSALQNELDVEPMSETAALYERIMAARAARPHNLPEETTPFVGRAVELTEISNLLGNPACRLLTIVGWGGMGKTRLALQAARQANSEQALLFLNGVYFVPLAGVNSAAAAPLALADALGLPLTGSGDPLQEVLNGLRNKELLLVLDNLEHLAEAASLLTPVLRAAPHVKFLVTSRQPLNLAEEWRLDLEGLEFAGEQGARGEGRGIDIDKEQAVELHSALEPRFPAEVLFLHAARQVQPDFRLTAQNLPLVQQLCRLVGGIPLALVLAAPWLRIMSIERIVAEVRRNLDLLATKARDLPPRQRSMRAIFDYAWSLLNPAEQSALAALSIFQGGIPEAAALPVAQATPTLLANLAERSLIQPQAMAQGMRYRLHELVRQYALEKLQGEAEWAAEVANAHCRYFAGRLQQIEPHLFDERQLNAHAELRLERENIVVAWHHAVTHESPPLLDTFVECLGELYLNRGWYRDGIALLEPAVARLRASEKFDEIAAVYAHLLNWQSTFYLSMERVDEAEERLGQSLWLAQQAEDPGQIAYALGRLSGVHKARFDYAQASKTAQQALALFQAIDDEDGAAWMHGQLGHLHLYQEEYAAARQQLQAGIAMYRRRQQLMPLAWLLSGLARVELERGHFVEAQRSLQETLALSEQVDNRFGRNIILARLATVAEVLGDYAEARRLMQQALDLARELGDFGAVASALTALGDTERRLGNPGAARRYLEEALPLHEHHGQWGDVALTLNILGLLDQAEHNWVTAQQRFEQSQTLFAKVKSARGLAQARCCLGQLAQARGEYALARAQYLAALDAIAGIDAPPVALMVLGPYAALLLATGEQRDALRLLAFVAAHPAATYETRNRAQTLLDQWATLHPTEIAQAIRSAQTLTLAEVISHYGGSNTASSV